MNPHLLNKIQSIKTLRDRAATEGEKDAAQHKLTLILAKHKLTEQDIPAPGFSTRHRPPPQRTRPRRTQSQQSSEQAFAETFERTMRDFEEAIRREDEQIKREWESYRNPFNTADMVKVETSVKVQWKGRLFHEMARGCGYTYVSTPRDKRIVWAVIGAPLDFMAVYEELVIDLKRACLKTRAKHNPKNPNAYDRAFYERATRIIYERLAKAYNQPCTFKKLRSREDVGGEEGAAFGIKVSLSPLTSS